MYNVGPYYAQDSMYYRTHDQMVDDFNQFMSEEFETEFRLPIIKEVCPVCQGEGTIVNRSIDGNGISADDFYDDPDFAEDYMRGVYNVVCDECNGRNVISVVDESRLDDETLKAWNEWQRDASDAVAENLAELRFGC